VRFNVRFDPTFETEEFQNNQPQLVSSFHDLIGDANGPNQNNGNGLSFGNSRARLPTLNDNNFQTSMGFVPARQPDTHRGSHMGQHNSSKERETIGSGIMKDSDSNALLNYTKKQKELTELVQRARQLEERKQKLCDELNLVKKRNLAHETSEGSSSGFSIWHILLLAVVSLIIGGVLST
jgi:hypothetical protein